MEYCDFNVLHNENGHIMFSDGQVLLENVKTGEIIKAKCSDITGHHNLSGGQNSSYEEDLIIYEPYGIEEEYEAQNVNCIEEVPSAVKEIENQNGESLASCAAKWTDGETKCMLNLYAEYFNNVGPLKEFKNKKAMWNGISEQLRKEFKCNWRDGQVETRYKCVMKRVKTILRHNNKSGEIYLDTGYNEEVNRIVAMDDSLFPDFVLSAGRFTKKRANSVMETTISNPPPAPSIHKPPAPPIHKHPIQTSPAPPIYTPPAPSMHISRTSSNHTTPVPLIPEPQIYIPPESSIPTPQTSLSNTPPIPLIPAHTTNILPGSLINTPSTSPSSMPLSSTDSPINTPEQMEENTGVSTPPPRRRVKKKLQEILCEKYFEQKKERYQEVKKMFLDSEKNKENRHREKQEFKMKRHLEKIKMLNEIKNKI